MTDRAHAWRNALIAGTFFGLAFGLINSYLNGWLPPATPGQAAAIVTQIVASGSIFALLMGLFASSRIVPSAVDVPLAPGDNICAYGLRQSLPQLRGSRRTPGADQDRARLRAARRQRAAWRSAHSAF